MDYPKALLLMSKEMQREFSPAASKAQTEWIGVETCCEARAALAKNPDTAVVISNQTLQDGNWCSVFVILRTVLFVAPSMRALDLLMEMRLRRVHMALVVDEFGGIDGLITIEDLVEEIVGEIEDEHDVAEGP